MVRSALFLTLAIALCHGVTAQEGRIEIPKRPCCRNGKPLPWKEYNKGVRWTQPMEKAVERAKKERKPLMVFHLVGDLDKEGC